MKEPNLHKDFKVQMNHHGTAMFRLASSAFLNSSQHLIFFHCAAMLT